MNNPDSKNKKTTDLENKEDYTEFLEWDEDTVDDFIQSLNIESDTGHSGIIGESES